MSPQALGPLGPLLVRLSSQQPWASLLCVLGSLLTAQLAFLATPLLDFVLGRDLRNPSEVGRPDPYLPACTWPPGHAQLGGSQLLLGGRVASSTSIILHALSLHLCASAG